MLMYPVLFVPLHCALLNLYEINVSVKMSLSVSVSKPCKEVSRTRSINEAVEEYKIDLGSPHWGH